MDDQRKLDLSTLLKKKMIKPISKRIWKSPDEQYETDDGAAAFESKTMGNTNQKLPFNDPNKAYNRLGSPRPYHIQEESDVFDPGSGVFVEPDPGTFDKKKGLESKKGGTIKKKSVVVSKKKSHPNW